MAAVLTVIDGLGRAAQDKALREMLYEYVVTDIRNVNQKAKNDKVRPISLVPAGSRHEFVPFGRKRERRREAQAPISWSGCSTSMGLWLIRLPKEPVN